MSKIGFLYPDQSPVMTSAAVKPLWSAGPGGPVLNLQPSYNYGPGGSGYGEGFAGAIPAVGGGNYSENIGGAANVVNVDAEGVSGGVSIQFQTTVNLKEGTLTQTETPEAHFSISDQTFNSIANDIGNVAHAFVTGVDALFSDFVTGAETIANDVGGFMWHALAGIDGDAVGVAGGRASLAPVALDPKALALLKEWHH